MVKWYEFTNPNTPDTMFGARHDELYAQLDEETLNQLLIDAYERYNESEKIILDIEAEKIRRRDEAQKR